MPPPNQNSPNQNQPQPDPSAQTPQPPVVPAGAQVIHVDSGIDRVIPHKNPPSLVAYYTGLFSFIPLIGAPLAIVAIVAGLKGLKLVKQQPEVYGKVHALVGLILGIIFGLAHLTLIVLLVVSGNR